MAASSSATAAAISKVASSSSAVSSLTIPTLSKFVKSSEFRWAAGGWAFFIAENAVLSENRTTLIEYLPGGDDGYHLLYGTFSTAATASIGYAYYKLKKQPQELQLPWRWVAATAAKRQAVPPMGNRVAAVATMAVGLIMASQALPKLQIPVTLVNTTTSDVDTATATEGGASGPAATGPAWKVKVLCPFDFTDQKSKHNNSNEDTQVVGLERISRHPGLWSMGLVGVGNAFLQPAMALSVWWLGPAAVAWLGAQHQDSRFRRGLGGTMDPMVESQTSNVPFVAMIMGKQGSSFMDSMGSLLFHELKPLNAMLATGAATMWIASRGRVRPR